MNAIRIPLLVVVVAAYALAQPFHPDIPRAWTDRDVAGFEIPLAQPDRSPRYLSAAEYYALEVTPIYRPGCYPVYLPRERARGIHPNLSSRRSPRFYSRPAKLRALRRIGFEPSPIALFVLPGRFHGRQRQASI